MNRNFVVINRENLKNFEQLLGKYHLALKKNLLLLLLVLTLRVSNNEAMVIKNIKNID